MTWHYHLIATRCSRRHFLGHFQQLQLEWTLVGSKLLMAVITFWFKVRTQCFSEKFRKHFFFFLIFLFLLKRSFHGIFGCFEVLLGSAWIQGKCYKFRNLCYKSAWSFNQTFTSNNNTCAIVSKINEHRLFILINTSYKILLVILLAKLSRLFSFFRV